MTTKSSKAKRIGPAPIASFEKSFDDAGPPPAPAPSVCGSCTGLSLNMEEVVVPEAGAALPLTTALRGNGPSEKTPLQTPITPLNNVQLVSSFYTFQSNHW